MYSTNLYQNKCIIIYDYDRPRVYNIVHTGSNIAGHYGVGHQ